MIYPTYSAFRLGFNPVGAPDVTGQPVWPLDQVRVPPFNAGFKLYNAIFGYPQETTLTAIPFVLSINSMADDASLGFDEYDWYVSQRTDDHSAQYIAPSQLSGKSGSLLVSVNTISGTSLSGNITKLLSTAVYTDLVSADSLSKIFKYCTAYVQERATGSIQLYRFDHELLTVP